MIYAVIGAQYGDEGKGRVVDYLTQNTRGKSIVVRYNGGAQAGHTVKFSNGRSHVFHHFGSGTISGAATYWSEYCIFDPIAFNKERSSLVSVFNINPLFFLDPNAMVITPFDIAINRMNAILNKHGSCGMGINECIRRNEDPFLSLRACHFEKDFVIATQILQRIHLKFVKDYYADNKLKNEELFPADLVLFIKRIIGHDYIHNFVDQYIIASNYCNVITLDKLDYYHNIIFEGAQGLMLDEHFGNFPYVTPSRTGSINITNICRKYNLRVDETIYVTRPYMTRHGFDKTFKAESIDKYFDVVDTTNVYNDWQKHIEYTPFNMHLFYKFIQYDAPYNNAVSTKLAITCIDQIKDVDNVPYYRDNVNILHFRTMDHLLSVLQHLLSLDGFYKFSSPYND